MDRSNTFSNHPKVEFDSMHSIESVGLDLNRIRNLFKIYRSSLPIIDELVMLRALNKYHPRYTKRELLLFVQLIQMELDSTRKGIEMLE